MNTKEKELRFGIIGCGAITEQYYLPAFENVSRARVTCLVDLNESRSRELAQRFDIPDVSDSYESIFNRVDGVIVATPPGSHTAISRACYEHGIHVLCEKPLTKDPAEVESLMAIQQEDLHLAVGMVRRMNPSSQLMKEFVQGGQIGKVTGFKAEEGSEFNWPLQTPHLFSTDGYGGILMDTGTHLLDLLSWCFDADTIHIAQCHDDNWGGVESNALIDVVMRGGSHEDVSGTIDLSFTRTLPNLITIHGEKGRLEVPSRGGAEIRFYTDTSKDSNYVVRSSKVDAQSRFNPFEAQIEAFVAAILDGSREYVTVEQAQRTVLAVEACRSMRKTQHFPWETINIQSRQGV
jgi:predicted dehydrogenase